MRCKTQFCKYLRKNCVSFGLVGNDTIVNKSVLCVAARKIFSKIFLRVFLCILNMEENTDILFLLFFHKKHFVQ